MAAYIFLWNPKTDPDSFENYERVLAEAAAARPYETRWICPSTRPRKGDIAFMQRTGPKNNGVFASLRSLGRLARPRNAGEEVVVVRELQNTQILDVLRAVLRRIVRSQAEH